MQWLGLAFVAVTGAVNTVQSGANAQLAKVLGQPWWAAVVVYLAGLAGLAAAVSITTGLGRSAFPAMDKVAAVPWWAWTGGLLGAAYVMAMLLFAEQLGSAVFTGVSVTAAVLTSVALDHFGLVGFKEHPFSLWRGIGAALMLGGVGLISRF